MVGWLCHVFVLFRFLTLKKNNICRLCGKCGQRSRKPFFLVPCFCLVNTVQSVQKKNKPLQNTKSPTQCQRRIYENTHFSCLMFELLVCGRQDHILQTAFFISRNTGSHVLSYKKIAADVRAYFSEEPFQNTVLILSRYT